MSQPVDPSEKTDRLPAVLATIAVLAVAVPVFAAIIRFIAKMADNEVIAGVGVLSIMALAGLCIWAWVALYGWLGPYLIERRRHRA